MVSNWFDKVLSTKNATHPALQLWEEEVKE